MYGILDRYVGKNMVFSVILVALCLTLFAGLISLIDALRYIGRGDIGFTFVLKYVCYKLPSLFSMFFPVSILIGGVVGLGLMAKKSELVILQSIGLSKLDICFSCIKSLLPVILVVLFISQTIAPQLDKYSEDQYYVHAKSNVSDISITSSGAWIKEGNTFVGITALLNRKTIAGVIRFEYEGNKLKSFARAYSGDYMEDGKWLMKDVNVHEFTSSGIVKSHRDSEVWPLSINHERIEVLNDMQRELTIVQLYDYIKYIENNGVDASRFRLSLYNKVLSPVIMLIMLLLALSTVFGPLRSVNMGSRILAGIALGFSYYVLNQIVAPLSIVYGIPAIIGATFSSVIFGGFAIYMLKKKL